MEPFGKPRPSAMSRCGVSLVAVDRARIPPIDLRRGIATADPESLSTWKPPINSDDRRLKSKPKLSYAQRRKEAKPKRLPREDLVWNFPSPQLESLFNYAPLRLGARSTSEFKDQTKAL